MSFPSGSTVVQVRFGNIRASLFSLFDWATSDNFSTLCYVRADLSPLAGSAQSKEGKGGKMYWTIVFSIEIHFGLTEFKARIKWTDNVSNLLF